ncbi:MAG: MBL fold metallo-hydrolase [Betaproteobacteria bacterium]|nr:MAG: MBL fold metallo-hydrolase [Betaproteobacteria bacterium]
MANDKEHELVYPFGDTLPAMGTTLEVAPGVRWVRMALPFALNHINLWLLRDEIDGREGWTIVDCGITNDATRAAWEQVFANELGGLPVLRVIVTHMHPDHIGLAHWLTERWQCRMWISATDYNAARMASQSTTGFGGDAAAAFFASHGLTDPDAIAKVRARSNYYAGMVPQVPLQFRRLLDGLTVRIGGHDWTCKVGYGHAPEHIALHCPDIEWGTPTPAASAPPSGATLGLGAARRSRSLLISGDMVLPRISTNVSVYDLEPEANPLPLYLDSIDRLRTLPADTLVLPSHGKPFVGLHARIAQLKAHHDERLADVLVACAEAPQHAASLLPVLFKRVLDLHQTTFAMGESVAHLHALWLAGQLKRRQSEDGIFRFALA